MQLVKRISIGVFVLLAIAVLTVYATGNAYLIQGIRKTYLVGEKSPDIDDMTLFDVRKIAHGEPRFPIKYSAIQSVAFPEQYAAWNDSLGTTAYLVYWRDSLLFERYWEGDSATVTNSFSMAKTVTTMLAGAAVTDGYLLSFDEPVSDFIQEWVRDPRGGKATFAQFSAMSAGHNWTESYYLPLNPTAELYYGDQAEAQVGHTDGVGWEVVAHSQWCYCVGHLR